MASCGLGSRRGVEQLVLEGKVQVNKVTVTELSFDVNEENDTVTVNGKKVVPTAKFSYVLFNKPKGCVCSENDDRERKTVYDYLNGIPSGLHLVGRLDYDTEGLLILTNDGDLNFRLTHPSNEIEKTYLVKTEGELTQEDLARLKKGIKTKEGITYGKSRIKFLRKEEKLFVYEVTISEGKNREIRKMMEEVGKNVAFLKRVSIGQLRLGGLSRGGWRFLTEDEVYYLKNL